ncbi:ATP-binding protein [Kolteria novifilia]
MDPQVDFSIVPHLYDLDGKHSGTMLLRSIPGSLVVLSWLYPRAAHWTLDRQGIKGHEGLTLLKPDEEEDAADEHEAPQGIGAGEIPDRKIYCLDLRLKSDPQAYIEEIKRIAAEHEVQTVDLMSWIQGKPKAEALSRYLQSPEEGFARPGDDAMAVKRRWYPVIDYSRCTNCMECLDFCLFGVYGVDDIERISVEQQDNCKKGCPACSRVCPENAIIFPQHKTAAIAGAAGEVGSVKIDLSKLFGGGDSLELAVEERDRELVADGRDAVGMAVGIPKRQAVVADRPRDELDDLMDDLDNLDL